MLETETKIWMALKGRVEDLVLSPVVPVVYPKEDAPAGRHIRVAHLPNANERLFAKGINPHRRRGILQLTLVSPINPQAAEVDMQTAALVAAHFPADLPMIFEGLKVRVERAPDIAQSLRDGPDWLTPVSVRWECFA